MRKKPNDARNIIALDYGGLPEGETSSGQVCPACHGGTTKEKSFSVSRRDGILFFNCHRASCSFRGAIDETAGNKEPRSGNPKSTGGKYIHTTPVNAATIRFLSQRFGIPRSILEHAELGWTGDDVGNHSRRISFPIWGPDSRKRGESYRSYQGAAPKALIGLTSPDSIASSWYKQTRVSDTLVIVEDQVSALKLSPHTHALALLGTNISEAKAEEIINGKYKQVLLSLDADAIAEAIKLQLRWRDKIPNMMIVGIAKDIKNMNKEEFNVYLKSIK